MSVAYYIVLNNDEPGFETFVNGKAVAQAADALDDLCEKAKIPRLDSFIGQSIDDFAELIDEHIDLPEGEDGAAKWFSPKDGIQAIDLLVKAIEKNSDAIAAASEVIEDLHEYKDVLSKAKAIGAEWHLALDI